jgi:hypothetical protein
MVVCRSVTKAEKEAEQEEDYLYCKARVSHIPEFSRSFKIYTYYLINV